MAIQAGGQVFCLLAVLPALPEFPQEMSVRVHQRALTERPHRYLRVAGGIPLFLSVALLVILLVDYDDVAFEIILIAIAFVCSALNAYWSWREWPINDEINSWEQNPEPARERYPALRAQWDRQHVIRTIGSMLALVCFTLVAILL